MINIQRLFYYIQLFKNSYIPESLPAKNNVKASNTTVIDGVLIIASIMTVSLNF